MPAKSRSEVFDPTQVGVYHCWNRLVRRRRLFGWDAFTGRDYSYRKDWMRDQFRRLAGSMAIQVLDYAVLDNHVHVVLRNRPDIVEGWSDEEVARRWWYVCPKRKDKTGAAMEPKPIELQEFLGNIDEYRSRLSDISWMMRLACQRVSRRANIEDEVDGRFFAKRFDCDRLMDEVDVLNCSLYVDLNWIHAGMAETPEESLYTSAYERIKARWRESNRSFGTDTFATNQVNGDDWLAPIFLDERAAAYVGPQQTPKESDCETAEDDTRPMFYNPIGTARVSDKGFLPITLDQYLDLLDTVGRVIRSDKRGAIPADIAPILQRLGYEPKKWLDGLLEVFESKPYLPSITPSG